MLPNQAVESAAKEAVLMIRSEKLMEQSEEYNGSIAALDVAGAAAEMTGSEEIVTVQALDIIGSVIEEAGDEILAGEGGAAGAIGIDDESLWYRAEIPMKKEHQKLLWECCSERKLDYIDMLALISLESNFNEKCSSGKYKGYFQISSAYAANMSKTLKTANKPLDGAVNIRWGTALYSWILADKRVVDLEGKKQRDAALSIYQRGSGGYDRYGINKSYLSKYYKKRGIIEAYFEDIPDDK